MKWIQVAAACALAGFGSVSQADTLYSEGFDNWAALPGVGWVFTNNSTPVGQNWFQGNAGIFVAQAGADDSYAAANFLSTQAASGSIDNWLISPEFGYSSGSQLTFYTRASDPDFFDLIEIRFSSGSASVVSGFTTLLGTVGRADAATYPLGWTAVTLALPASGSGRVGFRYGAADAQNTSYVGIDSLTVTGPAVPEPATLALYSLGLAAVGAAAARRRATQR